MTNLQDCAKAQAIHEMAQRYRTAITYYGPSPRPTAVKHVRARPLGLAVAVAVHGGPFSHLRSQPRVSRRPETSKRATVFFKRTAIRARSLPPAWLAAAGSRGHFT